MLSKPKQGQAFKALRGELKNMVIIYDDDIDKDNMSYCICKSGS